MDIEVVREFFFSQGMSEKDVALSENHRRMFADLAEVLYSQLPDNAYRTYAIFRLEEAAMIATKSLSHQELLEAWENGEEEDVDDKA